MDYEENESNHLPLIGVVALVLVISGGIFWWIFRGAEEQELVTPVALTPVGGQVEGTGGGPDAIELGGGVSESSAEVLQNLGVKVEAARPEEVAAQIAQILETGDFSRAGRALGGEESGISEQVLRQLQAMAGDSGFRLKKVREVGELEINRRKRFALEWEDDAEPLVLDMVRGVNGAWSVESVRMPLVAAAEPGATGIPAAGVESPPVPATIREDALSVSDSFLQAALKQDFSIAKTFVDTGKVSDAKIAAMCILFEEGKYRLNPEKPLRAMFGRETTAGFLANVLTADADKPAQFGVNLLRATAEEDWKVSEINLDSLLADYASRVAGGDVYYTPLVANPRGGETLVIFFGFDEEKLAPRTERQLHIVADILRTDPNRKLTISGHADALGSDEYNRKLSEQRATAVREYLATQGVGGDQIITLAEGESQPRRPNETEGGEDNPDGRRANRRTEIYLDF